ncbi:MAG TPA: hypothetical protein EYQ73_05875 [Candidatus Poseidoniales archaeon]|nr:hypothetical protein [Candidatus Poseidoniales archaeon]HIL64807.1 hypothetical protein [Candidatus Poseidoniales archaeon]
MVTMPPMWYGLLALVSILGVCTWWLHNFSDREELKRIAGISGAISMLGLVWITWNLEGL